MHKIVFSLFISVALVAVTKLYGETFTEGIAEGYAEGPGVTNSATLMLKGNKARLFPKNGSAMATNGVPMMDYDNMKMVLLAEKEKYYMELPIDSMEKNLVVEPLKLSPTGNKSRYLSVDAEEFKGTDKETGVDILAMGTKDVVTKINPLIAFQRISKDGLAMSKTGRALLNMGYFPVRIQASKGGKVFFFWEIRKLEPKKIDASVVEIPAGYVKFSEYMKKKNRTKAGR